ncbi:MAG: flagellar biosynthesis protein FlhA [Spirochaetales bacterium]|nr:flagellar biosynthesis protein FlhA [Spirochaetales bacterium]
MSDSAIKKSANNRSDILVAIGVVVIIGMLIIPLPTVLLDLFMSINLMVSLIMILIVLYTTKPLDFSVFPTLLLITTVFGLALNVSSTRLILSQGAEFDGKIVKAFASFVVGTEGTEGLVIGFIIFIILIAVQFIVITKGATRVAEVAARFTLDALPGKQMTIDNAYNSGALTEEEATNRKNELQNEVDFYGAMDGASKFISGNVKVGLLITVINVIGGIIVGTTIHGEPIGTALATYVSLSVGDGLVTQFPALLISTATGLIVTRAISDGTFGVEISKQFTQQSRVYWVGAVFMFLLGILPGFPWYILIPMSLLTAYLAYRLAGDERKKIAGETEVSEVDTDQEAPVEVSPVVPLDPLSLELGYGLIPLVDKEQGAELLDRITRIRRESALELGLVVPRIRIIDNMRLEPSEYSIKITGVSIGKGVIRIAHYLAINPGSVTEEIQGEKTIDPAFGLPALWIGEDQRELAERRGYTVVDAPSIIATHLTEIIKKHSFEMLGRQEVKKILDTLRTDYSAVVDEVTKALSLGEVQKILQGLLIEQVSIRNMIPILETMADYGVVSKEISFLIEKVRQTLGRQICLQYTDDGKVLRVLTIAPELEQMIIESRLDTAGGPIAALDPADHRKWINAVTNAVHNAQTVGYLPIILCSEAGRALVKRSTVRDIPELIVLSVPEIASEIITEGVGEITLEQKIESTAV